MGPLTTVRPTHFSQFPTVLVAMLVSTIWCPPREHTLRWISSHFRHPLDTRTPPVWLCPGFHTRDLTPFTCILCRHRKCVRLVESQSWGWCAGTRLLVFRYRWAISSRSSTVLSSHYAPALAERVPTSHVATANFVTRQGRYCRT